MRLWWHITNFQSDSQLSVQFYCRSQGNIEVIRKYLVRTPDAPFRDVGGNGYCCPPDLISKAVLLLARKRICNAIYL